MVLDGEANVQEGHPFSPLTSGGGNGDRFVETYLSLSLFFFLCACVFLSVSLFACARLLLNAFFCVFF